MFASQSQSLDLLIPKTIGVGASKRSHYDTIYTIEC